jgi:hypothetical protein
MGRAASGETFSVTGQMVLVRVGSRGIDRALAAGANSRRRSGANRRRLPDPRHPRRRRRVRRGCG